MKNKYQICGEVAHIILQNGIETMIDASALPLVMKFQNKWYAHKPNDKFYVCGWSKGKQIKLHRLIADPPTGYMVDHINGDSLDNRKTNLRVVTNSQNQQNRQGAQTNSTSGIRGVSWNKQRKKWVAHIKVNGQKKYLGIYKNIADAENAAIDGRKKYMTHSKEGVNA